MSARKPTGLPFSNWVDLLLEQARRDGKLDPPAKPGKPLEALRKPYDPDWWAKAYVRREKLDILPREFELRKEFASLISSLADSPQESKVRQNFCAWNDRVRKHNATVVSGPPSTLVTVDIDEIVEKWRRLRSKPR